MWRSGVALLRPLAVAAARAGRGGSAAGGRPLSAAASAEGEAAAGAAKRGRPRKVKESSEGTKTSKEQAAALDATPKARGRPARKPRAAAAAAADGAGTEAGDHTVLLVESPAKAKKIQEFLGDKYKVGNSAGRVQVCRASGAERARLGQAAAWAGRHVGSQRPAAGATR